MKQELQGSIIVIDLNETICPGVIDTLGRKYEQKANLNRLACCFMFQCRGECRACSSRAYTHEHQLTALFIRLCAFKKKFCFLLRVCMVRDGYVHMDAVPEEARRGHRSPGARVTGSCELPNQSVGNQTQVLCSS